MRRRPSRLARTSDKQNKRQAVIFAIATVVVIGLLIQFGPLLINVFGNVVYTLRGGDAETSQPTGKELLQPPILSGVSSATHSAKLSFSGIAPDSKGLIEIYVNDSLEEEIDLEDSSDFSAEVFLEKGKNTIKARYSVDGKTSSFTEEHIVTYTTEKPKLEVSFPADNANFTRADKNINVTGATDPENSVTVNSFRAIVDSDGSFSYLLQLNDGENNLIIEATNQAGVTTQKTLKVTYQP